MEQLEQIIGYTFQNKKLLKQALTHSSYANEKKLGKLGCNERLEFLGDAVLELISSDFLYAKFTQVPEGELTKKRASLVCEPSLAYCARQFGLPQYLLLGKGENMMGGRNRDSIVSDATEALLGAIYLDGGFEPAKDFVLKFILNDLEHKQLFYDSKTILQCSGEWTGCRKWNRSYKESCRTGSSISGNSGKEILILCVIHEEKKNWQVNYVFKEY